MIDTALLKYFMILKKTNQTQIAKELGITRQCLNNKVLGKKEFSRVEIMKIQDLLNLSLEDKEKIFYPRESVESNA